MAMLGVPTAGLELGANRCRALLNGMQVVADVTGDGEARRVDAPDVLRAGWKALSRAIAQRSTGGPTRAKAHVQATVCAVPYEDWRQADVVQQIRSTLHNRDGELLHNDGLTLHDVQVIPAGLGAIFAQAYELQGEDRIVVQREELLHQVVGVVHVGQESVSCLIFSSGLQLSERLARVQPRETDVARQVVSLISEYRNLLNVLVFAVVGEGLKDVAPTIVTSAPGIFVPADSEWAGATGARLFAAMRLRQLRQGTGEGGMPNG